uniref:sodium- and chloride-dependent taurine transporter-like isoform X1 n=2 Tax=Myxine glutinosa TaxID=7769 RepID=UPI00358E0B9A
MQPTCQIENQAVEARATDEASAETKARKVNKKNRTMIYEEQIQTASSGHMQQQSEMELHGCVDEDRGPLDGKMDTSRPTLPAISSRDQWASDLDFFLAITGMFIGLGNIWRFPYLCYKNGGGAFLIPYLIFLLGAGVPLFMMEIALGQFTGQGGIICWINVCPLLAGVGYGSFILVCFCSIYYIVVLGWTLFYLAHSFTNDLPWGTCNNIWNSPSCLEDNLRRNVVLTENGTNEINYTSPIIEFWQRKVLGISGGIDEVGELKWDLMICVLAMWILVFLCSWKGVTVTGKVSYFTATFPLIVLLVFVIRGCTLPGASYGIEYFLYPDLQHLMKPQVWLDAGTQVLYSYGIAFGELASLGSYNKYTCKSYKTVLIFSCINSLSCFISGLAIFSVLGFMAEEQGVSVADIADSGPGLVFIVYPKAVTMMPFPGLWAVLFFLMILLLGLDSQFGAMEGMVTTLLDSFKKQHQRLYFMIGCCTTSFFLGFMMLTEGGMYVFQLFDYYSCSGFCLLWLAFWECVAIAWIYGADRFCIAIEDMMGFPPHQWMKWSWMLVTPLLTLASFMFTLVKFEPLVYNKVYVYPSWAQGLGWCMALSSMLCVPGYAIVRLVGTKGSPCERIKELMKPKIDDLVAWRRKRLGLPEESHLLQCTNA